jgi:hypothetical protein
METGFTGHSTSFSSLRLIFSIYQFSKFLKLCFLIQSADFHFISKPVRTGFQPVFACLWLDSDPDRDTRTADSSDMVRQPHHQTGETSVLQVAYKSLLA